MQECIALKQMSVLFQNLPRFLGGRVAKAIGEMRAIIVARAVVFLYTCKILGSVIAHRTTLGGALVQKAQPLRQRVTEALGVTCVKIVC